MFPIVNNRKEMSNTQIIIEETPCGRTCNKAIQTKLNFIIHRSYSEKLFCYSIVIVVVSKPFVSICLFSFSLISVVNVVIIDFKNANNYCTAFIH